MIGYVTVGTNNMEKGAAFYDALMGTLGAARMMETDNFIVWGRSMAEPGISIIKPHNGETATAGNGTMIAIQASSPAEVDTVYNKAIELGATDEGAAGLRGETFYAGYFRDLDGNKLNVFCMSQAAA